MKGSKNNWLRTILINGLIFMGLLIFLEAGLRIAGCKPGPEAKFINIKQVDSLIVLDDFFTDSNGFYIANNEWGWESGINVNSEGFRTHEFSDTANPENKTRLMLLGDSFTWGIEADPISNCFADQLEQNGYQVFNLGIPGTDPAQYKALAKKYVPILKPDIVLVSFYMGNDWMKYPRKLTPNENIYHITNAGGILAHFDGKYFSDPREAYDLQIRKLYDQEYLDPALKRKSYLKWMVKLAMYKTVTGSRLLMFQSEIKGNSPEYKKSADWYSNVYLEQIKNICSISDCRFELFIIPWQADSVDPELFRPLIPHIIQNLSVNDYRPLPNDHFNNSGHKKYLDFISEILNEKE